MTRLAATLLAGVLAGAAGPNLPLPPTPPERPPAGEPAPIPNSDLRQQARATPTTEFYVHIFSLQEHGGGLAYIPGSAYPAPEDRRFAQTPGITVSVPMR